MGRSAPRERTPSVTIQPCPTTSEPKEDDAMTTHRSKMFAPLSHEEVPVGSSRGRHCTNCGGYITYPERFTICPMCGHKLN
jgi:hypothetical protein